MILSSAGGGGSATTAVKNKTKSFVAYSLTTVIRYKDMQVSPFVLLTVQLLEFGEHGFQQEKSAFHILRLGMLQYLCTLLEQRDQLIFSHHPRG